MPSVVIDGPLTVGERTRAMSLPTVTPCTQDAPPAKVSRAATGEAQAPGRANWLPFPGPNTAEATTLAGTLVIWSSSL